MPVRRYVTEPPHRGSESRVCRHYLWEQAPKPLRLTDAPAR